MTEAEHAIHDQKVPFLMFFDDRKGFTPMHKDKLDIRNLQKAEITVGDISDIICVLECLTSMFVLPPEATDALERLKKEHAHD
jgi:hypothetical protein